MMFYILNANGSQKMAVEGSPKSILLNLQGLHPSQYTTKAPKNPTDYWTGSSWIQIGQAPSNFHAFDYDSKMWIDRRSEEEVLNHKLLELKNLKVTKEASGFYFKNRRFDSDKDSQIKIMLATSVIQDLSWIDSDNQILDIPKDEVLDFKSALVNHLNAVSEWYNFEKSKLINDQRPL